MTRVRGWRAENPRAQLYLAMRAAGAAGLSRKWAVAEFAQIGEGEVDNLLLALAKTGYCIVTKAMGKPSRYKVTADCAKPVLLYLRLLPVLMDLISDCEAGMSERVLCDELCIDAELVRSTLRAAITALRVEVIHMPSAHGGGRGYRVARMALAPALAAAATAAQAYAGAAA